jgi:phosphatidylglycerol:prolipoprotein diacylglycerol transferase
MLYVAYIAAIFIILYLSKKQALPMSEMAAYLLFGVVVTFIGARLFLYLGNLVLNIPYYAHHPQEIWVWPTEGRSFYGGLVFGILYSVWYLHRFKLPFWRVGDVIAPGAALWQSIGRIGCFLAGCCYGRPSSLPWAVRFPKLSYSVHPTQLYELLLNLFNFVFLLLVLKRKRFDGQVVCFYAMNYAMIRFVIEFFRGDPERGFLFHGPSPLLSLSVPHAISLVVFTAGLTVYIILRKKKKKENS